MSRLICWFSRGAASTIATKLAIEEHYKNPKHDEIEVCRIYLKEEYEADAAMDQYEKYFGMPIKVLKNEKYNGSVNDVVKKTRYMSGVAGARCTKELKKQVRLDYQEPTDSHVFGLDCNEEHRVDQLLDTEPELDIIAPLIDKGLSKQDCFKMITDAGFQLPEMYQKGYHNNNCIGCLKAVGAGYWNKIRKDFPEVFEERSRQEELLGASLCKYNEDKLRENYPEHWLAMAKAHTEGKVRWSKDGNALRIPLRFLPEDAGSHKDLDIGACGFFCESKDLFD